MNPLSKSTWTLFGCGFFINDIIEAIEENRGKVTHIILNQPLDKETTAFIPKKVKVEYIEKFIPHTTHYFYGFMGHKKELLLQQLSKHNIVFSNLIHPFTSLAKSIVMGQGNYVGPGVVIAPNVELGNFNIINRNASLGHNVKIHNFNTIGPAAVLTGFDILGNHNFLGANSTVLPKIKLGNGVTLGAGGVLTKNAMHPGTYIGVPAKFFVLNS